MFLSSAHAIEGYHICLLPHDKKYQAFHFPQEEIVRILKLKLSGDIRMDDLYNGSSLRNNSLNALVKTWCSPRDIHVLGHAILFLYLAEVFLTQN